MSNLHGNKAAQTPYGARSHTRSAAHLWAVLLVAFMASLCACALGLGAQGVRSADAADSSDYSSHTIDTVDPSNTTVNLFDYWVVSGANDESATVDNDSHEGINSGHYLWFKYTGSGAGINKWTGSGGGQYSGIVASTLVDGYPYLASGKTYNSNSTTVGQSLAYLFDGTSYAAGTQDGKAAYPGVTGLFKVESGYYVYDSTVNYAAYDSSTNSFDVYDKPAIDGGQFFPLDPASEVFSISRGQLKANDTSAGSNSLNHHFGLSMSTVFTQPSDGLVSGNDMTFEFSGDDDVWVYIDGVLVSDVGGIHDAVSTSINFRTGQVLVNGKSKGTLASILKAGGVTEGLSGNTLADGSSHSLNFFYLERGAGASNMKIKFNLLTETVSQFEKVDQNNDAVDGAVFALYEADENYNVTNSTPISSGITNDGQFTLLSASGGLISFDAEAARGITHYVLREVSIPDGYRTGLYATSGESGLDELHLEYRKSAGGSGGVLVSPTEYVEVGDASQAVSRQWLNSGYIAGRETLMAPGLASGETLSYTDGGTFDPEDGMMFAVVYKKDASDTWVALKGDAVSGWSLCGEGAVGATEALNAGSAWTFTKDPLTGRYQTLIDELPGNVEKYAYILGVGEDSSEAEYTVRVYFQASDGTVGQVLTTKTGDDGSTVSVFDRQFASVIKVTNVQNRLWVQKVDEAGNTVTGATFSLYKESDVTDNGDGTYTVNAGAAAYDTLTTADVTSPYVMNGAGCFPTSDASPLSEGIYYLAETTVPAGYTLNTTVTKVIVAEDGVYVDAGAEDDGVKSMSGPGSLLSTLAAFGSNGSVDNTLTYITGTLQQGALDTSGDTPSIAWSDPAEGAESMDLEYSVQADGTSRVLQYVKVDGSGLPIIYSDTGINRMQLTQTGGTASNGDSLGGLELNQLFTTAVGVQYTDVRVPDLEVTKRVTDVDDGFDDASKAAAAEAEFYFELTLPEGATYDASIYKAVSTTDASGVTTTTEALVGDLKVKSGDVVTLKADETLRVYGIGQGKTVGAAEVNYDTRIEADLAQEEDASQAPVEDGQAEGAASQAEAAASEPEAEVDGQAEVSASGEEGSDAAAGTADGTESDAGVAGQASGEVADADAGIEPLSSTDGSSSLGTPARPDASARVNATQAPVRGFHLTARTFGNGVAYTPAAGEADNVMTTVTQAPATQSGQTAIDPRGQLVFTNAYEPTAAHLGQDGGFLASKTFTSNEEGRVWTADDTFTLRLVAEGMQGTESGYSPMPEGGVAADGAPYADVAVNAGTTSVKEGDADNTRTVRFGDISYSKPGTYTYLVREVQPAKPIAGVSYDFGEYRVAVKVVNEMDDQGVPTGRLAVEGVTMTQVVGADGVPLDESSEVTPAVAAFENVYDSAEQTVQLAAVKVYKGDDAMTADKLFSFTLSAVGSYDTLDNAGTPEWWSFNGTADLTTLDADASVPMPSAVQGVSDGDAEKATGLTVSNAVGDGHTGEVSFHSVTYTATDDLGQAGLGRTYVYKIVENAGERASVTYDSTVYYLVVECHPDGAGIDVSSAYYRVNANGSVTKVVDGDGEPTVPTFTNTYNASPAVTHIKAYKNLVGRGWNEFTERESFDFTLSAADEATRAAIAAGDISGLSGDASAASVTGSAVYVNDGVENYTDLDGNVQQKDTREVWFEQVVGQGVSFKKKGAYTFYITETSAHDATSGLTYDDTHWTVIVTVTDADDDGQLEAAVAYSNGTESNTERATFTNTYQARGSYPGINVAKTITGRAALADEFTFTVESLTYDGNNFGALNGTVYSGEAFAAGTKENLKGRSVYHGKDTTWTPYCGSFTEDSLGKTLLFRVSEDIPADAQADAATGLATKDGTSYDTSYTGSAYILVSVNALPSDKSQLYCVTTVMKGPGVQKLADESGLGADDDWAGVFTAEAVAALKADGANSVTVTSQLTDTGTVDTATQAKVTFQNDYHASLDYTAQCGVNVGKAVTGEGGSPSGTFRFHIAPADTQLNGQTVTTAEEAAEKLGIALDGTDKSLALTGYSPTDEAGNPVFSVASLFGSPVTFDETDAGKTYTFTVSEHVPSDAAGWTYDGTVYTVTIAIVDDGKGVLTATTTVTGADGSEPVVYTCSTAQAAASVPELDFTNEYDVTPATIAPVAVKRVAGVASTSDTFTFGLSAAGDATAQAIADGSITADAISSASDGEELVSTSGAIESAGYGQAVTFGDISFNRVTAEGESFNFTVREVAGTSGEWTYVADEPVLSVTVSDDGHGNLVTSCSWNKVQLGSDFAFTTQDEAGDPLALERPIFVNTNGTSKSYAGIVISKNLTGKTLKAGEFVFDVEPQDTLDADGNVITTASEAAAHQLANTRRLWNTAPAQGTNTSNTTALATSFAKDDDGKTFTYRISEEPGSSAGYTYDSSYYIVTVSPVSDGEGSMQVTTQVTHYSASGEQVGDVQTFVDAAGANVVGRPTAAFENSFKAKGDLEGGTASINATKTLTGRDMADGEFSFKLAFVYGDAADEQAIVLDSTGYNLAAKAGEAAGIYFPQIGFTVGYGLESYSGTATYDTLEECIKSGTLPLDEMLAAGLVSYDSAHEAYTVRLKVYEDTSNLPAGVTAGVNAVTRYVTVKVADKPSGVLDAEVTYDQGGSGISFANTYNPAKQVGAESGAAGYTVQILDADGKQVGVGDTLTYTLTWVNNAVDGEGNPASADVTVTDVLPECLTYVGVGGLPTGINASVSADARGRTQVSVTLPARAALASGSFTLTAKVNDGVYKLAQADGVGKVENIATVQVAGGSTYTGTTVNYTPVKKAEVVDASAGQAAGTVQVGQDVLYTISYKNTESSAATVVVRDTVPAGTTYVEGSASEGGALNDDATAVVWTLENVPAGQSGQVSFKVHVTAEANPGGTTNGVVTNSATVQVADNPQVSTNVTTLVVRHGTLELSKAVVAGSSVSATDVPDAWFNFTIALTDAGGAPLSGTYSFSGIVAGAAVQSRSLTFSQGTATLALKAGDSVRIAGLPEGAGYEVVETSSSSSSSSSRS